MPEGSEHALARSYKLTSAFIACCCASIFNTHQDPFASIGDKAALGDVVLEEVNAGIRRMLGMKRLLMLRAGPHGGLCCRQHVVSAVPRTVTDRCAGAQAQAEDIGGRCCWGSRCCNGILLVSLSRGSLLDSSSAQQPSKTLLLLPSSRTPA